MLKLLKLSCVIVAAAWGAAGQNQVWAYERDTHYYMRFALSLATCFNWDEARIIASGDWGMDENRTTGAEKNPLQTRNKVDWHAFGHRDNRFRDLWMRSITEKDPELRLVKLGQFMHFLEDWESHAGYFEKF